jgi:HAD superfamily hydrolase (TIGR01509 family)
VIRAVIFDVDGTLVDSVDLHAQAWRDTFLHFGKDVPFEDVRFQIGKGGDQLLPVFWPKDELEKIEKAMSKYRSDLFKEKFLEQVVSFPQVRQLVEELQRRGKELALASSANPDELAIYKKIAKIDDLIETATSKEDAEQSKPHPDIFQAALKQLGDPKPEECVVIGDTPYDIEAARKAGMGTIAVRCGGFPEDSLSDAIAIYDGPADLLAKLDASPLAE